jgi:VWFA-related protein
MSAMINRSQQPSHWLSRFQSIYPVVSAILFSLLTTQAISAEQSASAPSPIPVIQTTSDLVLLDTLVSQRKTGLLDTHLTASDFSLDEDGAPQQIRYFSQDKLPLSIVFMFDLTDSVRPMLKPLARSALAALQHLRPQDQVAVMTFSSSAQLIQPFTTDRAAVAAAIQRASEEKSGEATFLDEDVYEGAQEAQRATIPNSRRVLVFFTDGTANSTAPLVRKIAGKHAPAYLHTRTETRQKLLQSNVVVAALIDRPVGMTVLYRALDLSPASLAMGAEARLDDIARYAADTGGPVLHSNARQAAAKLATLLDELRLRYTLGYTPSTAKPPGSFCKITLRFTPAAVAAHPQLRHDEIRTRTGYYR